MPCWPRSVCLYSGGAARTSRFWATRAGREEPLPRPLGSPAYGKERGWCGPEGGREKADPWWSCPTVEKVTVGWDEGFWVRSTPTVGLEMGIGGLPKGLLLLLLGVDVRRKLPAKAS